MIDYLSGQDGAILTTRITSCVPSRKKLFFTTYIETLLTKTCTSKDIFLICLTKSERDRAVKFLINRCYKKENRNLKCLLRNVFERKNL